MNVTGDKVTQHASPAQLLQTGLESEGEASDTLNEWTCFPCSPPSSPVTKARITKPGKKCTTPVEKSEGIDPTHPRALKRPRCLKLTDKEIRRVHEYGHKPASVCVDTIMSQLTSVERTFWSKQIDVMTLRIESLVNSCQWCAKHGNRISPQASIHSSYCDFNVKMMLDVWQSQDDKAAQKRITGQKGVSRSAWHLVGIDVGSGDHFQWVWDHAPTGADVVDALFTRWISIRGPIREVCISDNGGEFVNAQMLELAARHNYVKEVTPAYFPENHGLVEVLNGAHRQCWKRVRSQQEWKPLTLRELQIIGCTIENELRNTLQGSGFSACQRATGRSSALALNLLSDSSVTPIEPEHCTTHEIATLVRCQNEAMDAYRSVVHDRKLRVFLKGQSRGPLNHYSTGDRVDFWKSRSCKSSET